MEEIDTDTSERFVIYSLITDELLTTKVFDTRVEAWSYVQDRRLDYIVIPIIV